MGYSNVEEEKKINADDWYNRGSYSFDGSSFLKMSEIEDLIIESNNLLKKSALGGISYTDQSDAIQKGNDQFNIIYKFIGEAFVKIQESIDEPLYTGFNTGATFYLGNVKIEEYTTANTLGLTESTTDGVNGAFLLKEKEELNLEDFLLGNLNGNMADYEYYSMFSKLYKEDCKNFGVNDYVRDEYLDGEFCTDGMMNYMGCVDEILTAGEYIHKKDNPWYIDILGVAAELVVIPTVISAITGKDILTGEKLTETERSMYGINAMINAGGVLAVGGVVLEETLLIGGKQVVTKTLSKKQYQKALEQATKKEVIGKDLIKGGADFYVAPNGKTLPGQYKDWLGTNMRESLINSVENPTLKKAIGEVYRSGSIIGDGGTADIIRFEQETGILLSKSGHTQKAVDMSKYFQKIVESGTLSPTDTKVAQDIINGLNAALGGK